MLQQVRAWLNGKREYYAGVALLAEAGGAAPLLAVLKKGPTAFSTAKLQGELLAICNQLKAEQDDAIQTTVTGTNADSHRVGHSAINGAERTEAERTTSLAHSGQAPANPALFESCHQEALKVYKTSMNDRAILFSQANALSAEEVNLPHHIESRAKLALAVVRNYRQASQLFDRADYVKTHGHLPAGEEADTQPEYDALPDDLVYTTLTNLRKAKSKLKKKEQTPERIVLLQQHESNIKKLEGRWRLLNAK